MSNDPVHHVEKQETDDRGRVWDPGWYFWDETADRTGPYETEAIAREKLDEYCRLYLSGLKLTIKLQTQQGEDVTELEIPAFKTLPVVVVWGIRTFVLAGPEVQVYSNAVAGMIPVYKEVFAYTAGS